METFEIIQHPLDWLSFTGSMAGLDEIGRESADQLMTMIGDMQYCRGDIRGTCARYFFFVDTEWFCKLCDAAGIDCRKLQNYLLSIENAGAGEVHDTFDNPQASFRFPKYQEPRAITYCAAETQSEPRSDRFSENNGESESSEDGAEQSCQGSGPRGVRRLKKMERFG